MQPSRLTLPPSDWPAQHLRQWQSATTDTNPFRERTPAADWTQNRRRKIEDAYGQYLAWLSKNGLLDPTLMPNQLITLELVEQYVDCLRVRVAPVTVAISISYLAVIAETIEPGLDWRWLRRVSQHLKVTARSIRDKRKAVVPVKDLHDMGVFLMQQADACKACTLSVATQFRDGLLIAFLATLPLRLSNFSDIELGVHLNHRNREYWLQFSPNETKTGCPIEGRVPYSLAFWLGRYLRNYRPFLMGGGTSVPSMALWVSTHGIKMSKGAIRQRIEHHTKKTFGRAIWPHLFRACCATSIATEDPEHVRLIADILGHAERATADRYYIQSNSLLAGRKYQQIIRTMRREGLKASRHKMRMA